VTLKVTEFTRSLSIRIHSTTPPFVHTIDSYIIAISVTVSKSFVHATLRLKTMPNQSYTLTNFTEKIRCSKIIVAHLFRIQGMICLLQNPLICLQEPRLLVPILIQIYPVHFFQSYFFIVHFNIILPPQVLQVVHFPVSLMRVTCPVTC
jgi:hypothetical protein